MPTTNLKNRTIFCHDNFEVLQGINSNSIDLIYLDPPFNTNKTYSAPIGSSAEGASFKDVWKDEDLKEEWLQTIKEDNDKLFNFLNGVKLIEGKKRLKSKSTSNFCYLSYMAIRLIEMHRILKDTGSIYLHCDPTMSHYIKLLMDIIFGEKNFINEIIWGYRTGGNSKNQFSKKHDIIFFYSKSKDKIFNTQYYLSLQKYKYGFGKKHGYELINKNGNYYKKSICRDLWDDINAIGTMGRPGEPRTDYPTQKPLSLLERIVKSSSNKGDIVLDPFCGCATTCVAAEKLGRQWVGIDVSLLAYKLVEKRLQKEVANPENLLQFQNQIYFTTTPPKRTDVNGDNYILKKYVYIISHPKHKNYYKVGIASDYKTRLNSYQTSDSLREYKLEYKKYTPLFREIEKYIHNKFENMLEWVKADLKDIINEIENYK